MLQILIVTTSYHGHSCIGIRCAKLFEATKIRVYHEIQPYGDVTYKRTKVTDAERIESLQKMFIR